MDILDTCSRLILECALCDSCLGRQFSSLDHGFGNREKGRGLKMMLHMHTQMLASSNRREAFILAKALVECGYDRSVAIFRKLRRRPNIAKKPCYICSGFMDKLEEFAVTAVDALKDVECSTVMVGCRMPLDVEEREDELKARFKLMHGENIRYEVTREIGRHITAMAGKGLDKLRPAVTIIVSLPGGEMEANFNPVFLKGRYRKLVGGIPQTKAPWLKGGSIEEIVGTPLLEATRGEGLKFHGAGREDADARMLGQGRPFVIEIIRPRKRTLDLALMQDKVNEQQRGRLEILGLSKADKRDVASVKIFGERARKTYRALIKLDREIGETDLTQIEQKLTDALICQRTPTRALKRRGDRFRQRRVYRAQFRTTSPDTLEATFLCDGGLYIKELISGDEGRTKPSFAELADRRAECVELEVLEIGETQ
jgi:tRNA pseudouridine synthase 10